MSEKAEREYEDGRRRLERHVESLKADLNGAEQALRRYESQKDSRIYFIDKIDEIIRGPVS